MVGDRLYTDIAMGTSAGVGTALVLSGETKREDLPGSPFQPDFVCENLANWRSWHGCWNARHPGNSVIGLL